MDVQTGLICIGVVVISAAAILCISLFSIREKSYEEAIAEQRKFPDDLLSSMLIFFMISSESSNFYLYKIYILIDFAYFIHR